MQLHLFEGREQAAKAAAEFIATRVNSGSVIGVATGRTPLGLYAELQKLTFPTPRAGFALDEYVGMAATDPSSFGYYVRTHIEPAFKMPAGSIRVPAGDALDPAAEAQHIEQEIAQLPVDLQILGVGSNGHIAFNEPGSDVDSDTRVVELSEQTRRDNAPDVVGEVPRSAISQGIGTIRRAKTLCLLATGESKAAAIAQLFSGKADPNWPVTLLAEHPDLHVFLDSEAAAKLPESARN